ncbi:MAG: ATP-binding protein [Gemmatimonadaceae bacterium]
MTTPSASLIEHLLHEEEGVTLDFKGEQYPFTGASDDEKVELLKDVLAFANSWRRADAYILIGVAEVRGGRGNVVGVSSHLEDAQLQQFVNSKVQRPLRFSYTAARIDDKEVAFIHIPVQERPFYLRRNFGRLTAETVYIRRGSSTDTARPDEIARMGRSENAVPDVALDVFFSDPASRTRIAPQIRSVVLAVPSRAEIPAYRGENTRSASSLLSAQTRSEYYRELASFTKANRLLTPVHLAISNSGGTTAHDIRLEIVVPCVHDGITVLDSDDFPSVPQREYDLLRMRMPSQARSPDIVARRVQDTWLIQAGADKVQPASAVWFHDSIYVGASRTTQVVFEATVFADNLATPHRQSLQLSVVASSESVTLERILELEADRFSRSPGHLAFLREHGLLDDSVR